MFVFIVWVSLFYWYGSGFFNGRVSYFSSKFDDRTFNAYLSIRKSYSIFVKFRWFRNFASILSCYRQWVDIFKWVEAWTGWNWNKAHSFLIFALLIFLKERRCLTLMNLKIFNSRVKKIEPHENQSKVFPLGQQISITPLRILQVIFKCYFLYFTKKGSSLGWTKQSHSHIFSTRIFFLSL